MSVGASSGSVSWTQRTNSYYSVKSIEKVSNIRLAIEDGTELRKEAINWNNGVGEAMSWGDVQSEWERYVEESREKNVVLGNDETDDLLFVDCLSRFEKQYIKTQYAKLMAWERAWEDEYDEYYMTMLTLTGSNRRDNGDLVEPVEHMSELLNGWNKAYNRLYKVFEDSEEWEYVRIMEPHKSGYPHLHIGIIHTEEKEVSDFEGVVNSHIKNCEFAEFEAHQLVEMEEQKTRKTAMEVSSRELDLELGCVSTQEADSEESMGAYMGSYMSKELDAEADVLDAEESLKRFYALVWADGSRRFSPSNKANSRIKEQWEKEREELEDEVEEDDEGGHVETVVERALEEREEDDEIEWELLGVVFNEDFNPDEQDVSELDMEDIHEVEPGSSGSLKASIGSYVGGKKPKHMGGVWSSEQGGYVHPE